MKHHDDNFFNEIRKRNQAEIEAYRREQERLRDEYEKQRRDDFLDQQDEHERALEEAQAELEEASDTADAEQAEEWEDVIEDENEKWRQLRKDLDDELRL